MLPGLGDSLGVRFDPSKLAEFARSQTGWRPRRGQAPSRSGPVAVRPGGGQALWATLRTVSGAISLKAAASTSTVLRI